MSELNKPAILISGDLINGATDRITVQDGDAICTYDRGIYEHVLRQEMEPQTRPFELQLVGDLHAAAAPVNQ